MIKTNRERAQEAREAKLEHIRELVSSGALVIREMTHAERTRSATRQTKLDINSTPAERDRREAVLKHMRKRAERVTLSTPTS